MGHRQTNGRRKHIDDANKRVGHLGTHNYRNQQQNMCKWDTNEQIDTASISTTTTSEWDTWVHTTTTPASKACASGTPTNKWMPRAYRRRQQASGTHECTQLPLLTTEHVQVKHRQTNGHHEHTNDSNNQVGRSGMHDYPGAAANKTCTSVTPTSKRTTPAYA